MKIFISADIEGTTGITDWNEAKYDNSIEYKQFQMQMTEEVSAACRGANIAGAKEIYVKDAHASAKNIIAANLPENVNLIRGWSGHPYLMVQGVDETFDAAIMIGYHSSANSAGNPLAHTISSSKVASITINDVPASEFLIYSLACNSIGVPVVFVSGDKNLCEQVKLFNKNIKTVSVSNGIGSSTTSIHPKRSLKLIEDGVAQAVSMNPDKCKTELPEYFVVEISFHSHVKAYHSSFYPGMVQKDVKTVIFETDDYFEVLRMLNFVI